MVSQLSFSYLHQNVDLNVKFEYMPSQAEAVRRSVQDVPPGWVGMAPDHVSDGYRELRRDLRRGARERFRRIRGRRHLHPPVRLGDRGGAGEGIPSEPPVQALRIQHGVVQVPLEGRGHVREPERR